MIFKSKTDIARMSFEDIQKLVFEFQTHQIELEMQNDELSRLQHALTTSLDSYAQLYELSPVPYLTLDESGVIQKVNDATAILLGRPMTELVNQKFGDFIHTSDQDNLYLFHRGLLANKKDLVFCAKLKETKESVSNPICEFVEECPDFICCLGGDTFNRVTHVECKASVSYSDSYELQIFMAINNVTDLKYTEAAIECLNEKLEQKIHRQTTELTASNLNLQQKNDELSLSKCQLMDRDVKFNAIYNASAEGIITVDCNSNIISANTAAETIFGYKSEELKDLGSNKLMPLLPELINNSSGSLALTETGSILEIEGLHKNGNVLFLEMSIVAFSTDKARYFTFIVRDVSARKHLEADNRQHLDKLAQVTRLGLMGEMASGIAHEVNQPLTAISNYAQASLNLIKTESPDLEKLADILAKTRQQALQAGQIIHRMRRYLKSQARDRRTIDLNSLIKNAVGFCQSELKQNSVLLNFEPECSLPPVYVDKIQIEQVLINLIRNSVDAMIKLPATVPRQLSICTCLTVDSNIQVRVKDSGLGIDKDQQQKILTPFYTTKTDGMGMGLSISRSLIEAHEGNLHFNSKPGKGTTFYFTLPIRKNSDE